MNLNPYHLIYLLLDFILIGATAEVDEIRLGDLEELLIESATGIYSIGAAVVQQVRIEERLGPHGAGNR